MTWIAETAGVPPWPDLCALCDGTHPTDQTQAYGESLSGVSSVGYAFNVAWLTVPACKACTTRLRGLARVGVSLLIAPWLILAAMVLLLPILGESGNLPDAAALVLVAGVVSGLGGLPLLYRYWYSRAVRLRILGENRIRLAIRRPAFARGFADASGVKLRRSLRPVNW